MNTKRLAIMGLSMGLMFTRAAAELVAWWDFNSPSLYGVAVDLRSGLAARLRGGASLSPEAAGHSGLPGDRAARFGTGAQRLQVPDASSLTAEFAGNTVSAAFWIRNNTMRTATALSVVSPAATVGGGRLFQTHSPWNNNTIYFDTGGCCDGRHRLQVTTNATWTAWRHIALVKNGDSKTIYLDGNPIATGVNTARVDAVVSQLFLGNAPNTVEAVDGDMDQVALFSHALSASDVAALFGGASPMALATAPNDFDADGLPDRWEERFLPGNPAGLGADPADFDLDGYSDAAELARGWNPVVAEADTDNDGLPDAVETRTGSYNGPHDTGTNPDLADTDGDTLTDSHEIAVTGTDPNRRDTDGDLLSDDVETGTGIFVDASNTGSLPLVANTDGDAFPDGAEVRYGSNPNDASSLPFTGSQRFLLALWDFDSSAVAGRADDVIVGYPGTSNGVYSPDGEGRTGQPGDRAMRFTPNQRVVVDAAFLRPVAAADAVTISWWQKVVTVRQSSAFWVDSPSSPGSRGIQAHAPWSDNNLYFDHAGCCNAGQTRLVGPIGFSPLTDWHHILLLKNGTTKQIWVNGVLRVDGTGTSPLPADFTTLYIGAASGGNFTDSIMDDFAIFAGGLNVEQIARLATGESPRTILNDRPILLTMEFLGGVSYRFSFPSFPGLVYLLETRESLETGDWGQTLTVPSQGVTTIIDSLGMPPGWSRAYLRVRVR